MKKSEKKARQTNKFPYFFTLSNIISLSRAFMAIPIVRAISQSNTPNAIFWLSMAVISDWLDGFLARKYNDVSDYGKFLDPLADKIVGFAILIILVDKLDFPLWFLYGLAARDFTISILTLYLHNVKNITTSANVPGKIFITVAALSLFLWFNPAWREIATVVVYLATGLMLYSWVIYIYELVTLIKRAPDKSETDS
ncbi:MAG: CDP-alcohol phosphatidyltransferase family protein [Candidatus Marinimicrobia bacterium]|nr:CDP-alcohol phosphatidyltransferase family protein [Candidatus Neomarinimicrobiota bacterium]MDD5581637.1 CDP-alcohol phosphatidyltransferase family protein [Candidatus Neomarinimicrobiota bacterium]